METTGTNFVYQWLWSNVRYHGRRYCEHHQAPGQSKGGCYHCKSEYAVIIDIKRNCGIIIQEKAKKNCAGKEALPHIHHKYN